MGNPNYTHKGLGNLGVGTTYPRDGRNPVEGIQFIDHNPRGVLRKNGIWNFSEEINFEKFNMVELIKDENSTLYNFGPLLVKKMQEIKAEGQVYYWKIDPKKRYTEKQQKEYESRKKCFL